MHSPVVTSSYRTRSFLSFCDSGPCLPFPISLSEAPPPAALLMPLRYFASFFYFHFYFNFIHSDFGYHFYVEPSTFASPSLTSSSPSSPSSTSLTHHHHTPMSCEPEDNLAHLFSVAICHSWESHCPLYHQKSECFSSSSPSLCPQNTVHSCFYIIVHNTPKMAGVLYLKQLVSTLTFFKSYLEICFFCEANQPINKGVFYIFNETILHSSVIFQSSASIQSVFR